MSSISISRGFTGFVDSERGHVSVESVTKRNMQAELEETRRQVHEELEAEFESRSKEHAARIEAICKTLQDSTNAFMEDFEKKVVSQIVDMSIRISEMILRSQLPDREMVEDVIRQTLAPVMDLQGVRVKLSASDAEMFRECTKEDLSRIVNQVEIVVDNDLKDGDVMIESRNGYFNAKLEERMKLLDTQLKERCGNAVAQRKQS